MPESKSFLSRLSKYLPTAERVFLLSLIAGIILLSLQGDSRLLRVSLIGLAVTYFLRMYEVIGIPVTPEEKIAFREMLAWVILPKVMWISCAISCLGLYGILSHWLGYKHMLMLGGTTFSIGILILLWSSAFGVKHLRFVAPVFLRGIPLLILDTYFFGFHFV